MECEITIIDLITGIVAIAGLGLSITALVLRRLDKKPKLSVNMTIGFFADLGPNPNISEDNLTISIGNPGEKNLRLSSIALEIKGMKNKLALINIKGEVQLPCVIEVGHSQLFWQDLHRVKLALRSRELTGKQQVRAIANDGLGNEHKSKKYVEIDLDELNEKD